MRLTTRLRPSTNALEMANSKWKRTHRWSSHFPRLNCHDRQESGKLCKSNEWRRLKLKENVSWEIIPVKIILGVVLGCGDDVIEINNDTLCVQVGEDYF